MPLDDDTLLAIIAVCLKKKEIDKKHRIKRLWVKERRHEKRQEFTYQDLLEELKLTVKNDFRHFLTSDASIYEELLSMIGPLIKKQDTLMREAIPVGLRLTTTLRFLATGCHFQNKKFYNAMSPVSISNIVQETCEAIISRLGEYIKPPESQEEWEAVANDFAERCKFPNCLGAVNGKHIAIIKPTGTHSLYYNYKKFFSVVLMGVVNANFEFLVADVDISGSISGLEDFRDTSIGKAVCENELSIPIAGGERDLPYVFVGDNGFQLTENFMKTFPADCITQNRQIYNEHINRVHQVTENTFGALCSQFGVLQKPINLAPEKVKPIVLACCYLYNFLKRKTAHHFWDEIFDKESLDGNLIKGSWREVAELISLQTPVPKKVWSKAEKVREQFVNFFNSEEIV